MRPAIISALLPLALAARSAPAPASPLRVEPREAGLGDVVAGEDASRAFVVANQCGEPVTLKAWRNAGLLVEGVPATVAPGALATVVLKTAEPVGGLGEFSLPADFAVEPARCGPLTLEIHGRVLQYFTSDPPNLQLRVELEPGRGGAAALRLARKDGAAASLANPAVEPFGDGAARLAGKIEITGRAEADGGWRGTLSVKPIPEPGLYFARFRFPADHPRQKSVAVTVLIRNLPPLDFFPAQARFHFPLTREQLRSEKPPARRVLVRAPPGRVPFAPGALRAEPAFLRARWAAPAPGEAMKNEAMLEITLVPDAPAGDFAGAIFIARSTQPGDESALAVSGRVE